jgi:hypothetical protein
METSDLLSIEDDAESLGWQIRFVSALDVELDLSGYLGLLYDDLVQWRRVAFQLEHHQFRHWILRGGTYTAYLPQ